MRGGHGVKLEWRLDVKCLLVNNITGYDTEVEQVINNLSYLDITLVCQGMLTVKLLKQGLNELRGSTREM